MERCFALFMRRTPGVAKSIGTAGGSSASGASFMVTLSMFSATDCFGTGYDPKTQFKEVLRAAVEHACLDANDPVLKGAASTPHTAEPRARAWQGEEWQGHARESLARTRVSLWGPEGAACRAYLADRCICEEAARAFSLGFEPNAYGRPALVIPWMDLDGVTVLGLKYRHIDGRSPKATSLKGSDSRTLFGLQRLAGAKVVLGIEGELNAISVWQACRADGVDVVSIGGHSNRDGLDLLQTIIARLRPRVSAVWLDDVEMCLRAGETLRTARLIRSPYGLDANDLLKDGTLRPFLLRSLDLTVASDPIPADGSEHSGEVLRVPAYGFPLPLSLFLPARLFADRTGAHFSLRMPGAGDSYRSKQPLVVISQPGTLEVPIPLDYARRWLRPVATDDIAA